MSFPYSDGPPYMIHSVQLLLDAEGYLDDRVIIDATAPDGIRHSLSIRAWHEQLINDHYEDAWKRMGAKLLAIADKVERSGLIKGAKRDYHGYLRF